MVRIGLDQEDNEFLLSGENSSCYGQLGRTDGQTEVEHGISILGPVPKQICVSCLLWTKTIKTVLEAQKCGVLGRNYARFLFGSCVR